MIRRSRETWGGRRLPTLVVGAALLVCVGSGVGWAASAVFAPPRDVLSKTAYTHVELVDGEVGSSLTLNSVAQWQATPVGTNQATGTVTSISAAGGDEVQAGDVLYSVNLRPVVVAAGQTPAFRQLSRGTNGADAQQLQSFLHETGFYDGEIDGKLGGESEQAIRAWQRSLGVEADGTVHLGDLIFVPSLPGRIALDEEIVFRGAALLGGEEVVSGLASEPIFTLPVTATQAASMPVGTRVNIRMADATWQASVAGQQPDPEGADQIEILLEGVDGATICSNACGTLPVVGQSLLSSEIITQPAVQGVVAPSAALLTAPDKKISVIDRQGVEHPVTVVASARGMSVITGVPAGLKVRVPATSDAGA